MYRIISRVSLRIGSMLEEEEGNTQRTRRAKPAGLPHVVHLNARGEHLNAVEQLDVVQDLSFFTLQSIHKLLW